jgi:hypothetical protein
MDCGGTVRLVGHVDVDAAPSPSPVAVRMNLGWNGGGWEEVATA